MPQPTQACGLEDLLAVHRFYVQTLERHLGHKIPVPAEVASAAAATMEASLDALRRWLRLLDLGVTSPMVRDALKEGGPQASAASLFRYYVLKASDSEIDRDKTDFIGTYLLKNPPAGRPRPTAAAPEGAQAEYAYGLCQKQAGEFQKEIEVLLGAPKRELPAQHEQLLREFQPLHQEADEFRHFDQLMDSGILQRVRELKSKFGASFYHPRVLGASAVYNVYFGKRFDELFREAAAQIHAFAAKVEQEGGSISSRVHGDVTVQNLAEMEESKIPKAEYGRAREQFHKVSAYKKAVDTRRHGRVPQGGAAAAPGAVTPAKTPAAVATPAAGPAPAVQSLAENVRPGSGAGLEENKVKGVVESIRNFVRAAETGAASVVPMRGGNILLSAAELEAFKADYAGEKSFRADYVNALAQVVALVARMQQEMDDYKARRTSSYLWKPHADSLTHLISAGNKALQDSAQIAGMAEKRGLGEKSKALQATMEKLRAQIGHAAQVLQN